MSIVSKPNISDITNIIKQMRQQVPTVPFQKMLQDALSELFSKSGIKDPGWVKFKMPNGTSISFKEFFTFAVKSSDTSVLSKIKELSKNTEIMKDIITRAGENANNLRRNKDAHLLDVIFDLSNTKTAQNTLKDGTNNFAV
ncbi:MAG: hypothetical protein NT030_06940, partial [Candidatus Saganbacteria bacterium]|nr:hypothetical protein [Candidatus Saganbacteria bacterium]